ncbi:atrophin-1 [Anopheles nili]|uniref:atrophin-1 n=1 Tax=Anopheles nili TaxID=185578 RepID=UPI00237B27EA|nr:atrophin-1 [Anopheles nili]
MDCCSSTNYVDYRQHSMNGNFCYPYSGGMLRSASPYAMASPGIATSGRYGADFRSTGSGLGGYHGGAGFDPGYDKYYGAYHHTPAAYQASGYYGNYSPSYHREYATGYGHYYHQAQSPYARGGAGLPSGYAGMTSSSSNPGGYLYPGRHYPSHPFGATRESYYHASHRDPHQQQQQQQQQHQHQQYANFASYGHLAPYRSSPMGPGSHEHSGGKSHHHSQPPPPPPQYPSPQSGFTGSHTERGMPTSGASSLEGVSGGSAGHPSPSPSLFGAANGYSSPGSDYTSLPASFSAASESPQHPQLANRQDTAEEEDAPTTATPTPTAVAMLGATEFTHGTKDTTTRMRKPKERKLHRSSRTSSPTGTTANAALGGGGVATAPATRMKSLDALTNLCWPEDEQMPSRMRKQSAANGSKAKDTTGNRKESNELDSTATASPSRPAGSGRRTKKQTASSKQSKEPKSSIENREKQANGAPPTPPVENKNVTPLPGFQQAFGSTEIGKFSEVFFNSSPAAADNSPPHHHALHHQQHADQHRHHQQQRQQQQQGPTSQQVPAQQPHGTMQQLVMESLNSYESDVDTLSPQPWDPSATAPGDTYEGVGATSTGYNLQIGTTFHPSYYESSSYSDHAVDSPLGNYFSEMTCNEFVN